MINRVCWLVGWLVGWFVCLFVCSFVRCARCEFSKSTSPVFIKLAHRREDGNIGL